MKTPRNGSLGLSNHGNRKGIWRLKDLSKKEVYELIFCGKKSIFVPTDKKEQEYYAQICRIS